MTPLNDKRDAGGPCAASPPWRRIAVLPAEPAVARDDLHPACLEIGEVASFDGAATAHRRYRAPGAIAVGVARAAAQNGQSRKGDRSQYDLAHIQSPLG